MAKTGFLALAVATVIIALLWLAYRWVDPLPPHRLTIVAGAAGSVYDGFARRYAGVLARHGITLEIRNAAGALEGMAQLMDPSSGVQAAFTTFAFAQTDDAESLHSLGGIFDAGIFVFYRGDEAISGFAQLRGKRVSIGPTGTALRSIMLEVLSRTDALDDSIRIQDLDNARAIDALIAGEIDVAIVANQPDADLVRRALASPAIRLMNVTQAKAIAKAIPGLTNVVLSRGIVSLSGDVPAADIDLLGTRNRVLVRKELHPALQHLLLEAMREVHGGTGPFHRHGEFPAAQPNDLPLSPTAEAFYRSQPTFWQQYTSFWFTSLLNRIVFFVIPVVVMLIPLFGLFGPRFYRWTRVRDIERLHRALRSVERDIPYGSGSAALVEHQARLAVIAGTVRDTRVSRPYEMDLQLLKIHLRMVQDEMTRAGTVER